MNNVQSIIMEIRAGTGGDEAGLFAADLHKMYSRYADSKEWQNKTLDFNQSDVGGIKKITFEIKGENAYNELQYEGGVHRVQRIPETEKRGRVHTSTATVAVFLKPKFDQTQIKPEDIEIDFYRSSGPGGQYVNKRETAVRILHKPTGIIATCQTERSQGANKETALGILEAMLLQKQEQDRMEQEAGNRKDQIKWAKRAEKIRTYNFPQNRITDHRINKKWHNLEKIIEGNLKPVVKVLKEKIESED